MKKKGTKSVVVERSSVMKKLTVGGVVVLDPGNWPLDCRGQGSLQLPYTEHYREDFHC